MTNGLISMRPVQRAACGNDPPHVATYFDVDDCTDYPPPCMYCAYAAEVEAHQGCAHSHHRAWRRWRITRRVRGFLYLSGITSDGGSIRWGMCSKCLPCPDCGSKTTGHNEGCPAL